MQDNALQNNPLAFFAGLVLFFAGLLVALFYLVVRTATESTILPGQHFRLKHFILALVCLLVARNRMKQSMFAATAAELKKDREWLKNLDKKSLSTN